MLYNQKIPGEGVIIFPLQSYTPRLSERLEQANLQESIGSTLLFSHFRPRDGTPENWLFPMHVHPRAYVCVIYETAKGKFAGEHRTIAWWRHSTTYTYQNPLGLSVVVFLCKLGLLCFKI